MASLLINAGMVPAIGTIPVTEIVPVHSDHQPFDAVNVSAVAAFDRLGPVFVRLLEVDSFCCNKSFRSSRRFPIHPIPEVCRCTPGNASRQHSPHDQRVPFFPS